jgi:hypothetical protein
LTSLQVCEIQLVSSIVYFNCFTDIDQKGRDSCVELAWLEQLEKKGQLPEWDYSELIHTLLCQLAISLLQ